MSKNFFGPEGNIENELFVSHSWLIDQWIGDQLWVWGNNSNAELGTNDSAAKSTPVTTFAGGNNWKQVSSVGNNNTVAVLKSDGSLWLWGRNAVGNLGTNNIITRSTPVTTFAGGNNWKQVSCSFNSSAAIKTDGTLWMWGSNIWHILGTNDNISRSTPVTTFAGGNNWRQVSCSELSTIAIKTDGTLWVWGRNNVGQLGTNDNISRSTPVTTFAGGNNWKQVSCSFNSSAAIKTDGTLWMWGYSTYLGLGTNNAIVKSTPVTTFAGGNDWKQVDVGDYHMGAIKTNGSLWLWGSNGPSNLGINDNINRYTPVTTFAGGNNWKQVSCLSTHTSAIKTDGTLWVWGTNSDGQLGTNDVVTKSTPVTTFAGGNNWKQVSRSYAVTAGLDDQASTVQIPQVQQETLVTGQAQYTTQGTYSWTCPAGVYSVCVVCVSGGGGGGPNNGGNGGSLAWKNAIPVSPGQFYTVVVGRAGPGGSNDNVFRAGGDSYFISLETVGATGSKGSTTSTGPIYGDGGGLGGQGYWSGGGAGGYSGNGGNAGTPTGSSGSGGGGGAYGTGSSYPGLNGGGVGILGEGANGGPGQPGSGGSGQCYGGGGGCGNGSTGGQGGCGGAVRIIWGPNRAFPSTNTGNL